jgi:hypothetical protein
MKFFYLSLIISAGLQAQVFTPAQINSIHTNKTANEGDVYLDTLNNEYFIGISNGSLAHFNMDSNKVKDIISENLIDETDLNSNDPEKAPTQRSVKAYVDSLTTPKMISNELFFDGREHTNTAYHNFYYISMRKGNGYVVIRYDRTNVNTEARVENSIDPQPLTLNDVVGLSY